MATRERVVEVLQSIRDDCRADVARREGLAFTGRNVAEALGEIEAKIDALAGIMALIVKGEISDE